MKSMPACQNTSMNFDAIQSNNTSPNYKNHRYSKENIQHPVNPLATSKSQKCLRKTTQFLFSHIGLVGLIVVYIVAGAFLFQLLEEREEKLLCQIAQGEQIAEITRLKQLFVSYIQQNTTSSTNSLEPDKDNLTIALQKISDILYQYRDFVINAASQQLYFQNNCTQTYEWTFANALLFAITVVTTIGYGNIAPVTSEGQLCCLCYATIGIPIFLLCLANISGVLGEMFRSFYAKAIYISCAIVRKRRRLARKVKHHEEIGIDTDHVYRNQYALDCQKTRYSINRPSHTTKDNDQFDDDFNHQNPRITVPLTVVMIIIALYIWMGSVLFHNIEGWTMVQSGYFCFITLTTIGFGDFVPGQESQDANVTGKLILGAIYALLGMAMLAMCFDLMQEEIVAKFRWIGTKIGIIDEATVNENSICELANTKHKSCSPATLSINGPNIIMHTDRTIMENENEYNLPIQHTKPVTIRKSSPRTDSARVHPMLPNEATLHQRIANTKLN